MIIWQQIYSYWLNWNAIYWNTLPHNFLSLPHSLSLFFCGFLHFGWGYRYGVYGLPMILILCYSQCLCVKCIVLHSHSASPYILCSTLITTQDLSIFDFLSHFAFLILMCTVFVYGKDVCVCVYVQKWMSFCACPLSNVNTMSCKCECVCTNSQLNDCKLIYLKLLQLSPTRFSCSVSPFLPHPLSLCLYLFLSLTHFKYMTFLVTRQ